jgi:hypothetical protein
LQHALGLHSRRRTACNVNRALIWVYGLKSSAQVTPTFLLTAALVSPSGHMVNLKRYREDQHGPCTSKQISTARGQGDVVTDRDGIFLVVGMVNAGTVSDRGSFGVGSCVGWCGGSVVYRSNKQTSHALRQNERDM